MWSTVRRDSDVAELVLRKEEGAGQEGCQGRDLQWEREKNPTGEGGVSAASTVAFEDRCNRREDQVASNLSLPKTSCP